ncbi:hypothetical protein PIB30_020124 [Stylosanthes scabra]|uniref:Uncharacterized protein n=1 Tax=Stylosanthes scabra TaxID=79078 RepID=A0ABU6X7B2_9FABA|nr:hypothetical protein [Stylosanthes scabra]
MAASKGNCFFSLCASNKREKSPKQGSSNMNSNEVKSAALSANDVARDTKIDAKFPSALDSVKVNNDGEEETSLSVGKEENVVVVLSFLIFGSVPLLVYGLQIHKNYYVGVKLAAVLVASVACIILLSIGKNYNRNTPKYYIKTVLIYVILALATSGVSYIAGDLIKNLREKLSGPSESGVVLTSYHAPFQASQSC